MKIHFIGFYFIAFTLPDFCLAESLSYLPPKEIISNTPRALQIFQLPTYGNQSFKQTFEFLSPYETNQELHEMTKPYYENRNQPSSYEIRASLPESSQQNHFPGTVYDEHPSLPVSNKYLVSHQGVSNRQLINVNYPSKTKENNQFEINYFPNQGEDSFKGSEYLPPPYVYNKFQQTYPEQKSSFKNPEYLSSLHATNGNRIQFDYAAKTLLNNFKASEYLPPLQSTIESTQQRPILSLEDANYLPPHRNTYPQISLTTTRNVSPANNPQLDQRNGYFTDQKPQPLSGSNYLPPVQNKTPLTEHAETSFKGSEYLPPTEDNFSGTGKQDKISGYNDFPKESIYSPEYKISHLNGNFQQQIFKGPDYLPPLEQTSEKIFLEREQISAGYDEFLRDSKEVLKNYDNLTPVKVDEETKTYKNTFLPPQQSTQNADVQPQLELTDKSEFRDTTLEITKENNESYGTNKIISDLQILPEGYDFDKPEHPEEALALLHSEDPRLHKSKAAKQPNYDMNIPIYNRPLQYRQKKFLNDSYFANHSEHKTSLQHITGSSSDYASATTSGQTLSANVYIPPEALTAELTDGNAKKNHVKGSHEIPKNNISTSQLHQGVEYLPSLANTSKVIDLKGTHATLNYNPLKNSVISYQGAVRSESNISSSITKRTSIPTTPAQGLYPTTNRPFLVVGTPVKVKQFEQFGVPSEYFIPSTSNSQNYEAFAKAPEKEGTSLSYTTSQVLPEFMSKNAQKDRIQSSYKDAITTTKSATLPIDKSVKLKVRTVQIVNSEGVKNLKTLETLDTNGIKTIKILGRSEQEEPMGEHQLIRIINGSDERTVQTVKIYNDN
uniref:DUF4794 domain-containing protein n=1 Tax=Glossina brevipalpis TaxID=37001 RepID=A0A1A9X3A3_9MUSC